MRFTARTTEWDLERAFERRAARGGDPGEIAGQYERDLSEARRSGAITEDQWVALEIRLQHAAAGAVGARA
ncbi:hypothetical protein [Rhodococcus rhodnii]|uniref:hypothetical protein n=1 Tax=Rhodococcus rhodnii TaxID=38312 RepID=UPI0009353574|nr:hypothetical protein [Rhodococcus rhodnii]